MNERVRKVSVRIADVTYHLITSESEASIQRAVAAAEQLVAAAREANPSLNQVAGVVLALLNATGDRERLADELRASGQKLSQAALDAETLRHEIRALKEQNTILLREVRRTQALGKKAEPAAPTSGADAVALNQDAPAEAPQPEDALAVERQDKGNITFVLDPRILQDGPLTAAAQPTPEPAAQPATEVAPAADPVIQPEDGAKAATDEKREEPRQPGRLIQTGFDDLLAHD